MHITINGRELFFDVEGVALGIDDDGVHERPTLILLHGAPGISDHTAYKPAFTALADVAQIIYLDLAGAGRSDPNPDGFSLEAWADDIVELCDALHITKPIVLGNSAGGMVAAMYAIRHPDHPAKIILSSTQAKLTPQRCVDVFERLGGDAVRKAAADALIDDGSMESLLTYGTVCVPLYNTTEQPEAFAKATFRVEVATAFHELGGIWHTMDHLDRLSAITCPTLVIAGTEDPVTPIQDSIDIVERLTSCDVRFEPFDDAGHSVWNDNPGRAFQILRDFITAAPR